jgi:glycosyltransferase involved in cell wall biosynthesis
MRILHVIPRFPYFGGRTIVGGSASALLTLVLAQQDAGDDVTILSSTPGRVGAFRIDGGPRVVSLASEADRTVGFALRFMWHAMRWLRANRSRYDVVHVHSGHADYFLLAAILRLASGLPTLHSLYCPIDPQGRVSRPLVRTLVRRCGNSIDFRCGMSNNVRDSMTAFGFQSVECVRPALDLQRFSPVAGESPLRRELGVPPDAVVVLFVGNATPQKNLAGVLRAIHLLLPEFPHLRLVATTELKHSSTDAHLTELANLSRQLGLQDRVIMRGIVDNMPELMRASDILVAPFVDTFGPSDYFMAALEAMASGKPVVVSGVGGMKELVSPDVGAQVDPADPESIAAGLRVFCSDGTLRERAGRSARRLMEAQFSPPEIARTYRTIYGRLAP